MDIEFQCTWCSQCTLVVLKILGKCIEDELRVTKKINLDDHMQ